MYARVLNINQLHLFISLSPSLEIYKYTYWIYLYLFDLIWYTTRSYVTVLLILLVVVATRITSKVNHISLHRTTNDKTNPWRIVEDINSLNGLYLLIWFNAVERRARFISLTIDYSLVSIALPRSLIDEYQHRCNWLPVIHCAEFQAKYELNAWGERGRLLHGWIR